MKKWEYEELRVTYPYGEKWDLDELNKLGQEGWELIRFTCNKCYGIFKREIVDEEGTDKKP